MLQRIREGISGPVAWAILGLLALVFAVWGINMDFTPTTFAVKVNGEEIPAEPIRQAVQNQISQAQQSFPGDLPEELQAQIRNQVVEQAVLERLLAQRTEEQGYRVGDVELSRSIREMPVFQVGGQFSMDSYQARVRAAGYTTPVFEEQQRRRFEMQQLETAIVESSFVTDAELESYVRLDQERRDVEWIGFQAGDFLDDIEIADADIEARYEASPELFQTEDQVDLDYIEIRLENLVGGLEVSEDELRDFYETERSRSPELFVTEERRRARHVLIAVDDDTDDEAALEKADEVLSRLQAGESFDEVATSESDDSGSAAQGGDLGWVERGMMVAPFEEALFALNDGELSGPVRSRFGYHVIRLDEVEAGSEKTFEDSRAELEEEFRRRKAEDLYYERGEELAALAFENPDSLAPAAEALGVEVQSVSGVTRVSGPAVAGEAKVREAAFSTDVLDSGENSPIIELSEDHAVVLRVTDHRLPETRPLAEVRDGIAQDLKDEAAREQLQLLAEQARKRLDDGETASTIAADIGGQYNPRESIGRTSAGIPAQLSAAVFAASAPAGTTAVIETTDIPGGVAVLRLFSVTPGKMSDLDSEALEALRERLAREAAIRELSAYMAQLRSEAAVVVVDNQIE